MSHTHSLYKTLTGAINGINKTFVLPTIPVAGSVRIFVNGLEQLEGTDFTVSGTTIAFVEAPLAEPAPADEIHAHYEEVA